jgi:prepilin peptidase CpaA
MIALVVPDAVCAVVCLVAVVTDLRSRTIPNWLCLAGVAAGLALNPLLMSLELGLGPGLKLGLMSSVVGCLLLFFVFLLFGLINFVGMGDVKLMAAVGALLRWPTALWALAYVTLSGGVLALLYALATGRMLPVLRNLLTMGGNVFRKQQGRKQVQLHRIPYALAILVGACWAAAIKYFPVLRVP